MANDNIFVQYLTFGADGSLDKAATFTALETAFTAWYERTQEDSAEVLSAIQKVFAGRARPVLAMPELVAQSWQVTGRDASEMTACKWESRVSAYVKGHPSMFKPKVGRTGGVEYLGDRPAVPAAPVETVAVVEAPAAETVAEAPSVPVVEPEVVEELSETTDEEV